MNIHMRTCRAVISMWWRPLQREPQIPGISDESPEIVSFFSFSLFEHLTIDEDRIISPPMQIYLKKKKNSKETILDAYIILLWNKTTKLFLKKPKLLGAGLLFTLVFSSLSTDSQDFVQATQWSSLWSSRKTTFVLSCCHLGRQSEVFTRSDIITWSAIRGPFLCRLLVIVFF